MLIPNKIHKVLQISSKLYDRKLFWQHKTVKYVFKLIIYNLIKNWLLWELLKEKNSYNRKQFRPVVSIFFFFQKFLEQ